MITLYVKLGTMPGVLMICDHTPAEPGERLLVKEVAQGSKWQSALLSEIRQVGGRSLYVMEKF